jgi:hypothetical protein
LQINKRDMTACKPDKAAILSEVVKKVSWMWNNGNFQKILLFSRRSMLEIYGWNIFLGCIFWVAKLWILMCKKIVFYSISNLDRNSNPANCNSNPARHNPIKHKT